MLTQENRKQRTDPPYLLKNFKPSTLKKEAIQSSELSEEKKAVMEEVAQEFSVRANKYENKYYKLTLAGTLGLAISMGTTGMLLLNQDKPAIAGSNQIESDGTLLVGQTLKIPPMNAIVDEVKGDETVETLSEFYGVDASQLKLSQPTLPSGQLSVGELVTIPGKADHLLKNRQKTEVNYPTLIPEPSAEPAVLPSLKKPEETETNYSTTISVPSSAIEVFPVQTAVWVSQTEPIYTVKRREPVSPELPPLGVPEQSFPDSPARFKGYMWPTKGVLTSGYGMRWGRMHKGVDIAGPLGTPIVAAASGKVISAGWNSGGYGNLLKIKHSNCSITLYAHNSRILVRKGQKVSQGQQIAFMGSTGHSTGPHLHFEIHPKGGRAANPMAFLPKKR